MKTNIKSVLDWALNISLLLMVVVLGYVVVTEHVLKPHNPPSQFTGKELVGKVLTSEIGVGINGSIVLAISTTCHYCTSSMGFYSRLLAPAKAARVGVRAVLPQPKPESRKHLDGFGLQDIEVVSMPLSNIKVPVTPVILLTDAHQVIKRVWVGYLPPDKEVEVISAIAELRGH